MSTAPDLNAHRMNNGRLDVSDAVPFGSGSGESSTQGDTAARQGMGLPLGSTSPNALHLKPAALYGPSGNFVRMIGPHTEADPAAVLVQFLVGFGNALGRGPFFTVESTRHGMNLFAAIVGESSKARKGTSLQRVLHVLGASDAAWLGRNARGLSSGEGLIEAVRDAGTDKKGAIPGVEDKRLMVIESEFASVLRRMGREGNSLSALLREAWDGGDLQSMTRASPLRATGAHVSLVTHVTREELLKLLGIELSNGLANRFLWISARRSKLLPEGGSLEADSLSPLISQVREAIKVGKSSAHLRRSSEAKALWADVYESLSQAGFGSHGAVTARAEAQTMRLACIYALLDESTTVERHHLEAALAVWEYANESARLIFGEKHGNPRADKLLLALEQSPNGLTRTLISKTVFGNHLDAEAIRDLLEALRAGGKAWCEKSRTQGNSVETWFAASVRRGP